MNLELSHLSAAERNQYLMDNADFVEENFSYWHQLEPEELQEFETTLSKNVVKISEAEEEKAAFMQEFKLKVTPLKDVLKELTQIVKSRSVEKMEDVFAFKDFENNEVAYYNRDGKEVVRRKMFANERQTELHLSHSLTRRKAAGQ